MLPFLIGNLVIIKNSD